MKLGGELPSILSIKKAEYERQWLCGWERDWKYWNINIFT